MRGRGRGETRNGEIRVSFSVRGFGTRQDTLPLINSAPTLVPATPAVTAFHGVYHTHKYNIVNGVTVGLLLQQLPKL